MGAYKRLNQIISDYVGYREDDEEYLMEDINRDVPSSAPDDCADPVLFDNITDECTRHIKGTTPFEMLSDDAKHCIKEWEEEMVSMNQYNFNLQTGEIIEP